MVVGYTFAGIAPAFEDLATAKAKLRHECQQLNIHTMRKTQTGTAGAVEFEEKGGLTLVDASITGQTWVAQISAYAENVVVTLVWENVAGTQTTSTVTLTDANETAFTTAITTGYKAVSCSIDVVNPAGVTVKVGITGMATPMATIQAEATAAVAADLHGLGDLYVYEETNTAADVGEIVSGEYINKAGTRKYFMGTLAADTTTATRCYEATYVSGTLTVSSTAVQDYYRKGRWVHFAQVAGKYIAIGSPWKAHYGVIEEGIDKSLHSRYYAPVTDTLGRTYKSYFGGVKGWANTAAIAATITYTEYGSAVAKTIPLVSFPSTSVEIRDEPCIPLAAGTEVTITVLGNTAVLAMEVIYLEMINPK